MTIFLHRLGTTICSQKSKYSQLTGQTVQVYHLIYSIRTFAWIELYLQPINKQEKQHYREIKLSL